MKKTPVTKAQFLLRPNDCDKCNLVPVSNKNIFNQFKRIVTMVKNILETKSTLKSIEKSLDKSQVLSAEKQRELKGGCSACEDNRRPPHNG